MPENFRELCERAQRESAIETVAEIVDRLLQAVIEKQSREDRSFLTEGH
jgi:hypothetical protein